MSYTDLPDDDVAKPPQEPRRYADRNIPIGVVVVLAMQLAGWVWYSSGQATTLKQVTDHIALQDNRLDKVDDRIVSMEMSLAVLKDRSTDSAETTHRIENYLHSKGK